jgi:endoglycosylceramidase
MFMSAFEPARGEYNYTYLETVRGIVEQLQKRDIYVVLDHHQDVLAQRFCGEGIPEWAVINSKLTPEFPLPVGEFLSSSCCDFLGPRPF